MFWILACVVAIAVGESCTETVGEAYGEAGGDTLVASHVMSLAAEVKRLQHELRALSIRTSALEESCANEHIPVDAPPPEWYGWGVTDWTLRYIATLSYVQHRVIPPIVAGKGFMKTRVPDSILPLLQRHWQAAAVFESPEEYESAASENPCLSTPDDMPTLLLDLGPLGTQVLAWMQPHLEEWAGVRLRSETYYGLRIYRNGSSLCPHADNAETRHVGIIIIVDKDAHSPWPLRIEDHDGVLHDVEFEAGDAVFYESARLLHGRPLPLNGSFYASLLLHYTLPDRKYLKSEMEGRFPSGWDVGTDT